MSRPRALRISVARGRAAEALMSSVRERVGPSVAVDMSDSRAEVEARIHAMASDHLRPGQEYWLIVTVPKAAGDRAWARMAWTTLATIGLDRHPDPATWRYDAVCGVYRRGPFRTPEVAS